MTRTPWRALVLLIVLCAILFAALTLRGRDPAHPALDPSPRESGIGPISQLPPHDKLRYRSLDLGIPQSSLAAQPIIDDRISQIEQQLQPARLHYNPPADLAVGETAEIAAGLTPLTNADVAEADNAIAASLGLTLAELRRVTVKTAIQMEAELKGDPRAFRIEPRHDEKPQVVIPDEITTWKWGVTALRPGVHTLSLSIVALVILEGNQATKQQVYSDRINIRIDPVITSQFIAERYWLPLVTGFLTLALGTGASIVRRHLHRRRRAALLNKLAAVKATQEKTCLFLSYSRRDERIAVRLASDLFNLGIPVWLDQRELRSGENWLEAIVRSISRADGLIIILSPASTKSINVRKELDTALHHGKIIFPLLYRRCKLPAQIADLHQIDFSQDYATGFRRLKEDLRDAGLLQQHAS